MGGNLVCFGKLLKAQCYCSGLEVCDQCGLSSSEETGRGVLFWALIGCKCLRRACSCSFELKSLMSWNLKS